MFSNFAVSRASCSFFAGLSDFSSRWSFLKCVLIIFTPKMGENSHFDEHIFPIGLVQPPVIKTCLSSDTVDGEKKSGYIASTTT